MSEQGRGKYRKKKKIACDVHICNCVSVISGSSSCCFTVVGLVQREVPAQFMFPRRPGYNAQGVRSHFYAGARKE